MEVLEHYSRKSLGRGVGLWNERHVAARMCAPPEHAAAGAAASKLSPFQISMSVLECRCLGCPVRLAGTHTAQGCAYRCGSILRS